MAKKKDENFIPYKFKELLVYSSPEWLAEGKKKYQRVFETAEVSYLYAEFSFYNKLFDEYDWSVKVSIKCFSVDVDYKKQKEVCSIQVDREVKTDENVVYIREGWGNATPGAFWNKGVYIWEASLDGTLLDSEYFYLEDGGAVTEEGNPYFEIDKICLYESENSIPPRLERQYFIRFDGSHTRYIWAEVSIENLRPEQDWFCELFFNFYNDARQLKGRTSELILVKKGTEMLELCSGWGSDHKGTWYPDKYTLELVFMDQLIAIVPFEVGDEFEEGEPESYDAVMGIPSALKTPEPEESLEDVMKELDELIGLEGIKDKVTEYTQYLNFLKLREEKGFDDPQKIALHAVLTGNPGTGKTTVGKLLGKLYHKMGLLSKGHIHEVDRADLVGEFIGQTAPKVKDAIKKARGGVLFIDEAYALARSSDDSKDYGREVIEIVLKEMSDGPGDLAVLVAGYPKEMATFLDSNPGLKSRFNMYFDFPDFVPQELMEIANYVCGKRKINVGEQAKEYLYEQLVEAFRNRDRSFGNARYVNSLLGEAKMNMGLRLMKAEKPDELSDEELSTISYEDLGKIFGKNAGIKPDIPIDEDHVHEGLAELNDMIGLSEVKKEVKELVKLVRFYRDTGKDVINSFSLHTVFTGNPGTGKTSVARIMAKIFKALGVLEKGHIVECDRQALVAGFTGQTAIKTTAKIDEAMGGVLFIDEAYSLTQGGQGDFGKEAVETILKRMEDDRGKFVVIVAGYPKNMEVFLESNPGLKSRFDKEIKFEDFNNNELYEIAVQMLKDNELEPDAKAAKHLKTYFSYLHDSRDKYFGNARSIRKVIEEAVKKQHLRMASIPKEERTSKLLETLSIADVMDFVADKYAANIGFGMPSKPYSQPKGAVEDDSGSAGGTS